MEENEPQDNRTDNGMSTTQDNAKRMRTDYDSQGNSNSLESENNLNGNNEPLLTVDLVDCIDNGLAADYVQNQSPENAEIDEDSHRSSSSSSSSNQFNFSDSDDEDLLADMGNDSDNSNNTVQNIVSDTLSSDDEEEVNEQKFEVLRKSKPKHSFLLLPEIMQRQYGFPGKKPNPGRFQRKCYGALMSVQKLELMYKLEEHAGCVNCLNFSPNGKYLASGSDDRKVVIWDWAVGKSLLKVQTHHSRNIFQARFLDLKGSDLHLATCGQDGQVWYLQVGNEGLKHERKLGQHRGASHKLAILKAQPQVFLSAGEDGVVLSHDIRKPKSTKVVYCKDETDNQLPLYSIHPHPLKSHEFCLAGQEPTVRVYDQRKSSRPITKFYPFRESEINSVRGALHLTCAVYNHDGSEILASYSAENIYIFDTNQPIGNYEHKFSGHRNVATLKGVSYFGPRSEFVMSGSDCGHIFIWDKKTEAVAQLLLADDSGVVNCLEQHPQIPFLASSGLDWDVKLWVPSCEEEPTLEALPSTVRDNIQNSMNDFSLDSESQILWMLWRQLRTGSSLHSPGNSRSRSDLNHSRSGRLNLNFLTVDSSDESSSESHFMRSDDEDLNDAPSDCRTS